MSNKEGWQHRTATEILIKTAEKEEELWRIAKFRAALAGANKKATIKVLEKIKKIVEQQT